jgi:hypothetical protein
MLRMGWICLFKIFILSRLKSASGSRFRFAADTFTFIDAGLLIILFPERSRVRHDDEFPE